MPVDHQCTDFFFETDTAAPSLKLIVFQWFMAHAIKKQRPNRLGLLNHADIGIII